ncbi:hypothetical protein MBLNU459_g0803t1 [Dothideomycetes sp. NU459]
MTIISTDIAPGEIHLSVDASPGYTHADDLSNDSASKASELLTLNHTLYNTRFNGGFHNHIAHHILALWSLGATPNELQDMWEYNKIYQAPINEKTLIRSMSISEPLDLRDPVVFNKCLGNNDYYLEFLTYFQTEVSERGMPAVIKEYVLKGDKRADDIFCRMYTGQISHVDFTSSLLTYASILDLCHPIIHLGYAIEYEQPGILAEALASACVHDDWPRHFLLPTEELARSRKDSPSKSLLQIFNDLNNDPVIHEAVKDDDPFNKIRDGLLSRVGAQELAPYLSEFRVDLSEPDDLQRKMEDVMYTNAYALGAMQRPGKLETIDFVLLHNVTLSVFYPAILAQDWLSDQEKARLLEFTARVDAVMYAACGSPVLYPKRISGYTPRHPEHGWSQLFHRANVYRDEGHVAKLMRALYALQQLSQPQSGFPIGKSDFLKIAHMAI